MQRLTSPTQSYAWGSRTALPEFLGLASPSAEPMAELWIGAHPSAPSRLPEQSLLEAITADPHGLLGPALARAHGPSLPFLLKVLAVAGPLSLQVHPDRARARHGFAREEEQGIARNAPQRLFRDDNHKPELIYALTPFDALCGLRPALQIVELLNDLGVAALKPAAEALGRRPGAPALRRLLEAVLRAPDPAGLVDAVLDAGSRRAALGSRFAAAYDGAADLHARFPHDPGVVMSLLLNRLHLEPGQAAFLPSGRLHAYLSGLGVEVQACSDNVLRGGLTPKHVDVDRLLDAADLGPEQLTVVPRQPGRDGWTRYAVPVGDFAFSTARITGQPISSHHDGPQLLLCVDGTVTLTDAGHDLELRRGQAVFAAAGSRIGIRGRGGVVRARAGDRRLG